MMQILKVWFSVNNQVKHKILQKKKQKKDWFCQLLRKQFKKWEMKVKLKLNWEMIENSNGLSTEMMSF